jgi:hypothetical protein
MGPSEDFWQIFGRHLIRYRDPGLALDVDSGPGRFAVLTGLPDVELNIAGLHRPAGAAEAAALVDRIDRVGAPALVFVSGDADPAIRGVLAAHGFEPTLLAEPLMWRPGASPPPDAGSAFAIRRVADEHDLAGLVLVLEAAITLPPEVSQRQFALERLVGDGLGAWLAWDGDQPVSAVTLSWDAEACGVWEMMTMPAQRRRGAARATLVAALGAVLQPTIAGSVLVSTPLGRPMYEGLGFVAVDESTTWTRGASAADLARIGQTSGAPA